MTRARLDLPYMELRIAPGIGAHATTNHGEVSEHYATLNVDALFVTENTPGSPRFYAGVSLQGGVTDEDGFTRGHIGGGALAGVVGEVGDQHLRFRWRVGAGLSYRNFAAETSRAVVRHEAVMIDGMFSLGFMADDVGAYVEGAVGIGSGPGPRADGWIQMDAEARLSVGFTSRFDL